MTCTMTLCEHRLSTGLESCRFLKKIKIKKNALQFFFQQTILPGKTFFSGLDYIYCRCV